MSVSKNILKMFLIFFIINSVLKFLKESFSDAGGLKEWNTDQELDEPTQADLARAQGGGIIRGRGGRGRRGRGRRGRGRRGRGQKMDEDICVPIGEGENCW